MLINSFSFLFVLAIHCYVHSCTAQTIPSDNVPFTQDSITKYLQKANTDPMTHILKSYEASSHNYLVPYYLSRHTKIDSTDQALYYANRTMLTTFSSFVGDVKANESTYIDPHQEDIEIPVDTNYIAVDAIEELASVAKKHQVIMLNESHIDPRGRLFLMNLLPTLKAAGFTYLFMEGLREDGINERGFPLQTSGFYTSEPMYGNLIRKAIQLGFKLVPYDCYQDPCDGAPSREQHQATVIYETLKKHPQAKAIVYAGHGHITKDPERNWMAYRFKTLSGIDPFCINQAINSETPALFRQLRKTITKPVIYKNSSTNTYQKFSQTKVKSDVTVVFPNTEWIGGQYARWLFHSGKKPYKLTLNGQKYTQSLLSIVKCHEFDQYGTLTVPVMNIVLQQIAPTEIFLDKGSYYLRVIDLYGKELHKEKITL
ncbi:hypothetical protein GCM10023231_01560 [Olivibacter ginsenosidimutans]|uniref:Erythromycin esterase family protein n=1 Tax=Olivibacter ginsenosidimutans TaxID=1176537 RepID=A0ABP9AET1_9SPHI